MFESLTLTSMHASNDSSLLADLVLHAADRHGDRKALTANAASLTYRELAHDVMCVASAFVDLGIARQERIAVYLEKRFEHVVAVFAASLAGCAFVPVNPILKAPQVGYILRDCNVRVLVTSRERLLALRDELTSCDDLRHVVVVDGFDEETASGAWRFAVHAWSGLREAPRRTFHRVIDADMTAILYTSGSTGRPKGVVLSHRNMVAGAKSVAAYLRNHAEDALLAVLPLSFDAGFSQLTTAFHVGARVVLLNHLLPRDVVATLARERITGLTAVPPLYIQLAQLQWPTEIGEHLRYFANTGGRMPLATLARLRAIVPNTKPFLMYGLTEAFRSTYLPPEEVDRRPDSIGKAIPNAEILVLRPDGTRCAVDEPGELVHRGALVGLGYWNDPEKTAERYKRLPTGVREPGIVQEELAVFSGDTVRMDADGFLYFIGRRDEMIKTSGYRVSPTEIEEAIYATGLVAEVAAFGIEDAVLGQAIAVVATASAQAALEPSQVIAECRRRLPIYMVPSFVKVAAAPLPRNANGKIDRRALATSYAEAASETRAEAGAAGRADA